MKLRVFIGYDEREKIAYEVAEKTAKAWGCEVIPLYEEVLRDQGLLTRPVDRRGGLFDLNSDAPQATTFAISRFFVPILAHAGWCLFADSDVVFLEDPLELMAHADDRKAVIVVKHDYRPTEETKMRGQPQTTYSKKLWSSVCLWNCSHPANRRLNVMMLNQRAGRDLHAFCWLHEDEIGSLPATANWLVGIQPKPERPQIAHFTLGTPDMPERRETEHDELWWQHARAA